MTTWINKSDNTVNLELGGILFWVVKGESYGQAIAISEQWESGKMKYPDSPCAKVI